VRIFQSHHVDSRVIGDSDTADLAIEDSVDPDFEGSHIVDITRTDAADINSINPIKNKNLDHLNGIIEGVTIREAVDEVFEAIRPDSNISSDLATNSRMRLFRRIVGTRWRIRGRDWNLRNYHHRKRRGIQVMLVRRIWT